MPANAPAPPSPPWPDPDTARQLTVVKLDPAGRRVTDYPGTVVPTRLPPPWIAVKAVWRNRLVALDGLEFHPGDTLIEYFSPEAWFNLFAVHAPGGRLRGWYANVTYPARYDPTTTPPTLTWHDLFVDVIVVPGRPPVVRDEDELAAAAVAVDEPDLYDRILAARDEMLARIAVGEFPFATALGDSRGGK